MRIIYWLFVLIILSCDAKSIYTKNIMDKVLNKYGQPTLNRFIYLQNIISKYKNSSDVEKLKVINDFFNKVKYASDKKVWNKKDYWATPFEFLSKDMGDSEDFVFAKYFTLINELNLDSSKFFFTYVKSIKKNASYMVLAYYKDKKSIPVILDSINYKVLPANKRRDIIPIYSFGMKSNKKNSRLSKKFKSQQGIKLRTLLNNIKKGKV